METDKPKAKARSKVTQNPLPSSSMEHISIHERKWIDVEPPQEYMPQDAQSYPVSKRMIALLRHGTIPREEEAIEFCTLKEDFKPVFPNSVYWLIGMWIDHLQKSGGRKKRFQLCTNYTGLEILHYRAFQGGSIFTGQRVDSK